MDNKNEKIDVSYVAHLARMHLTDEECGRFQAQMEQIVGYVRKINELDLDGIEPTSHTKPVDNVFREDVVKPGLDRDVVLENAPLSKDGQFTVPKIIG
jgi:aspartyl-tRNA(Asn)/glutamyl-tRNA(Gln) amidotransferase subunit C